MRTTILYIILFTFSQLTLSQTTLSFDDVIELTQQSFNVTTAKVNRDIALEQYKFYRTGLKPQIQLNAFAPNFIKTSSQITQPDGSQAFQSISQNNASASLHISQAISATGGRVFLQSELQRYDDFSNDFKLYNGVPIRIGIEQPLFGFNQFKYRNKIEPLLKEESIKQYNIDIENALLGVSELYFNALIAKENQLIAASNVEVNKRLLTITYERFNLGKVSLDEKLQLEIELKSAERNFKRATYETGFTLAQLQTYLGLSPGDSSLLIRPATLPEISIDMAQLETAAIANSPIVLAHQRREWEAEQQIARQKAEYGVRANLFASFGYARGSDELNKIYTDPFDEQQIGLSITVPLLDWGRKKTAVKVAELQMTNTQERIEQEKLELKNDVRQTALLFLQLQDEIQLLGTMVKTANERAEISNQRYVLGDISITDLTIAQRENDNTKREFTAALRNYWMAYYQLRVLTGYDILKNQNIYYN